MNSTNVFPLPPPGYAGTEWIVYDLAVNLAKMGHDVTVAAPQGSTMPPGVALIPTTPPTWDQNAERAFWPTLWPQFYDQAADKAKFDIVHDHSFWGWPYMVGKDHPQVNICWTLHSYIPMSKPPPVPHPNLITLSRFMAYYWSQKVGTHVEFVYNGIDPNRYQYSDKKSNRYLFLGRIADFKGPHEAVWIAKELRVPVDIVGEDRFTGNPQYPLNVAESTKGTTAKYVGTVDNETKVAYLRDAKALLLPELWGEPFGLIVLEANASGTPVIATRLGALPEIIVDGKTGFLCNDVKEMKECIGKESEIDPAACREHVVSKFTAERMARDYEALYLRTLAGNGW